MMTHDKLLARIESKQQDYYADDQSLNALYTVVELHKPAFAVVDGVKGAEWCYQCADQRGYAKYPCPTIQAIEREIK